MKLVIKGHAIHGKKVIEIFEMLGGINELDLKGTEAYSYYYIDDSSNIIYCVLSVSPNDYNVYSLEEFLEKFPYKVGDKVKKVRIEDFIGRITNAQWDNNENQIIYTVEWNDATQSKLTYFARGLQPYKEETMEEKEISDAIVGRFICLEGYDFYDDKDNIIDTKKIIMKRKKLKYPKTYVECEKILRCFSSVYVDGYKTELLEVFQKLLICRDAYWKIAGEQMGLGKPWEPDWNNGYVEKYYIYLKQNEIEKSSRFFEHHFLAFPTKEIRDIFYENFKDLIENCKELL